MFLKRQTSPFGLGVTSLALAITIGPGLAALACAQAPEGKTLELQTGKPDARRDDPKARALLEEVSKAYKALTSYSDKGEFVLAMHIGEKKERQSLPLNLTFVRPNKLALDAGQVRLLSDGASMTTTVVPLKRYTTGPAPQKVSLDTFREGPIGSLLFGGPSAPPMFIFLSLLTGGDAGAAITQLGGSRHSAPAAEPNPLDAGKPASQSLVISLGEGKPSIVLTIDPATKLLSSVDLKIDAAQLAAGGPGGQKISIDKFGWNSGVVSTSVPNGQSFAYEAPKGFTKVDSLAEQQDPQHAANDRVGKPAPNFTLTLLDGPGKTRTVTKAELAGKVVVIDFWATWCGPCLAELPEIQKLVESYAGTKKDVVVVALSQDEDPSELTAVRKLVEKTLADKKINLTGNPVGHIGLDPSKSVGTAFELEGYPTLVILDGKGVVQAFHVGFNPQAAEPLHKSLAREIDAILDGKSQGGVGGKDKAPGDNAAKR